MCFGSTFTPSIQISRYPMFGFDDHFACMTKSCQWPRCSSARLMVSRQGLGLLSTRDMVMYLFSPRKESGPDPLSTPPLASWCHSTIEPALLRDDGVPSSSHFG